MTQSVIMKQTGLIGGYLKKRNILFTTILFTFILLNASPKAPFFPKKDSTMTMHGVSWTDTYTHLSDESFKKEKAKYIKEEIKNYESNKSNYWREYLRISKSHISGPQYYTTAPYRKGDWYYYQTFDQYFPYGIYYRINRVTGRKKMYFDPEKLVSNKRSASVGKIDFSDNDQYIAYTASFEGDEVYRLYIKDITKNDILKEKIFNVYDFYWANDSKTLIYLQIDKEKNNLFIKKHKVDTDPSQDIVLLQNKYIGQEISMRLAKSKDRLLIVNKVNNKKDFYYYLLTSDSDELSGFLQALFIKLAKIDYYDGRYYFLSKSDNANNNLYQIDTNNQDELKLLMEGTDKSPLIDFQLFKDYIAVKTLENTEPRVVVYHKETQKIKRVSFQQESYSLSFYHNYEADSDTLALTFESLSRPQVSFNYNMRDESIKIVQKISPSKDYNPKDYVEKKVYVTGKDSLLVPMTIVYNKNLFNGKNPCLLEAYGSYGMNLDLSFSYSRINMLNRGWVFAYAHVRGGSEKGDGWYQQGKMLNKKNSISDFIACSEYLIHQKYCDPQLLAITGGSAGGIIIGAAINERPELYHTAIASVPFVDLISYSLDKEDPSNIFHYSEIGSPHIKEEFNYLYSYSPYHNIKKQNYPNVFISTGKNDQRVNPDIPLKWALKLRENNTANTKIIVNYEEYLGHFSTLEEERMYAFLIWATRKNIE